MKSKAKQIIQPNGKEAYVLFDTLPIEEKIAAFSAMKASLMKSIEAEAKKTEERMRMLKEASDLAK